MFTSTYIMCISCLFHVYIIYHVNIIIIKGSLEVKLPTICTSTFPSQNVKNTWGSDHFWRFRCRFPWQAQRIVHLVKSEQNVRVLSHFQLQLHHTTHQYSSLQLQLHLHYIPLHYTTLNYTQLHSITLHYTILHYTTLHYTT